MKQLIRKILKEESEEMSPLEKTVAKFIDMSLENYDLPEDFYKVAVDIFPDNYGRKVCAITMLFNKPFNGKDSDKMHLITNKIKREINDYFGDAFLYISNSSSTVDNYNDTKDWYTRRKNK
jgi:hypothetical protein